MVRGFVFVFALVLSTPLPGRAAAAVTLSPANLNFAKLPVGESSPPRQVTLTNNQSKSLTFNSIAATGDFALNNNTCGSSIAAHAACTVRVVFKPKVTGTRNGALTFTDNASNSPQTVSLKGTGGAAALVSIAVTPLNSSIFVGATVQYAATGAYSNNTTQDLSGTAIWNTTAPAIASVSNTGLATALAGGAATITANSGSIAGSASLTVTQAFFPTGSLNTARYYHTATLLNGGYVLAAGGIGPNPAGGLGALTVLSSAELYNPGTAAFTFTGSLNVPRDEHSATLLNSGAVLLAGGSGGDGELASAELYHPATGTFSLTGSLNTARFEHAAAALPDGTVLIAGGYGGAGVLASAEIYSPVTGKFVATGSLNDARYGATATLLPDGTVLVAGGADAGGALASAEIYDPAGGTFTLTGSLHIARSGATATLLNTGSVLVANGYNYASNGPLTSAELYDPSAGTFTATGLPASTGWLGTATLLTNGAVLFAGSVLNASSAEIFSPANGTFGVTSNLYTPRYLQTATMLPDGAVLLAGGLSNVTGAVLANAETYQPMMLAPPSLVSISISPANPALAAGGTQPLVATGTFSNDSTQHLASVIWTSSNPVVATVTNDETNPGVAYGVGSGTAVISACAGAVCGSTSVTVSGGAGRRQ